MARLKHLGFLVLDAMIRLETKFFSEKNVQFDKAKLEVIRKRSISSHE